MVQAGLGDAAVVRPRSVCDVPQCVRVLREVHRQNGYPTRWPGDPAAWLSPPDVVEAWVAVDHGTVCGHVALVAGLDDLEATELIGGSSHAWQAVSRLFVDPAAQGTGLGAALLRTVMHFARERDLNLLLDVVDRDRSPAIALYERLGWKLLGDRAAGWVQSDGVRPQLRLYAFPPYTH